MLKVQQAINLAISRLETDLFVQVPESVCLKSLSYHEAWELSYFGASVLHPRTTMPAMKYSIPISIRNFFNQSSPGAPAAAAAAAAAAVGVGSSWASVQPPVLRQPLHLGNLCRKQKDFH